RGITSLPAYGDIRTPAAAIKAGPVDYLAKPADADDVVRALLARPDENPAPPENPMSADRVRWEHIQRVYELCGHNVSETARRLNMHRRTLQRILAKRAPREVASVEALRAFALALPEAQERTGYGEPDFHFRGRS